MEFRFYGTNKPDLKEIVKCLILETTENIIKLKLIDYNVDVSMPLSADTAFNKNLLDETDAYFAMYHDQGLPVLKALSFGDSINITLGVPIVRTSVDHGVALDIAGKGIANNSSLKNAFYAADNLI